MKLDGSFTKFDERDPDRNFFDDIAKLNFETSYFKLNKVLMSYMSIFEVLKVILKT